MAKGPAKRRCIELVCKHTPSDMASGHESKLLLRGLVRDAAAAAPTWCTAALLDQLA